MITIALGLRVNSTLYQPQWLRQSG